jgi:hypothetical protein
MIKKHPTKKGFLIIIMIKEILLFIFFIFFTLPLWGDDLFICQKNTSCCSDPQSSPYPENYDFFESKTFKGKIYSCRKDLKEALEEVDKVPMRPETQVCTEKKSSTLLEIVENFPPDCGYNWSKFNLNSYKDLVTQFLQDGTVLCDPKGHPTMCTSAVYLAFLIQIKRLKEEGKLSQAKYESLTKFPGDSWKYLNNQARPDLLLQDNNLGIGKRLRRGEFPSKNWPKEGDLVQLWRDNHSGHSIVFSGYLTNSQGKAIGICYWTSNIKTNGYGKMCEDLGAINRLIVARFNE